MTRAIPFALAAVLAASCARAVETNSIPPAPVRRVTDNAGAMSATARDALEARLAQYERQTGHQVIVWIGDTIGGRPIEDFAARAFSAWGIGRKGHDDGVALFVFMQDRGSRIEVGYGLEPELTDVEAGRILDTHFVPLMRANDPDRAISTTADAIIAELEGQPMASTGTPMPAPDTRGAPEEPPAQRAPSPIEMLLMLAGGLVLVFLVIRYPWLAFFIFRGMRGGGGGGGGFGGGGGRSGGGGASRNW